MLSLFCDIDNNSIRILTLRCEKFLSKLQMEDANEEMESNADLDNF